MHASPASHQLTADCDRGPAVPVWWSPLRLTAAKQCHLAPRAADSIVHQDEGACVGVRSLLHFLIERKYTLGV